MNYEILTTELSSAEYAGLTNNEIELLINNKDILTKKEISSLDIQRYLLLNSLWLPIKNSTSDAAKVTIDSLDIFESFDIKDTSVETMLIYILDQLIAAIPEFTETHKATILDMGETYISRSEFLGLGYTTQGHIQAAKTI